MMKELDIRVTIDEANSILEALGQQPFVNVYGLIAKIQEQAKEQLSSTAKAADNAALSPLPSIGNAIDAG